MASIPDITVNVKINMTFTGKNKKIVVDRLVRHKSGEWPSSSCSYGCNEPHWKRLFAAERLFSREKIDEFIDLLRVRLKYTECRQISVTRTDMFGENEQLVGGYELDSPEKVESFLSELKEQLLTGSRPQLYGESDEYHENYGYRAYKERHYDFTPCCDPEHKTCWHACSSGKWYSCSQKTHCHVVDCGHMMKSSGHKRENEEIS